MFLLFITLLGEFKLEKCFSYLNPSSQNLLLLNVTAFAFKFLFFSPVYFFFIFLSLLIYLPLMSFCSCENFFWPRRTRWYQGKEELLEKISLTKEI